MYTRRIFGALIAVTTALTLTACSSEEPGTPTVPKAQKSSTTTSAPTSTTPSEPVVPAGNDLECPSGEPEFTWALPEWQGNSCLFAKEALGLLIESATSVGLPTAEALDFAVIGSEMSEQCAGEQVSGNEEYPASWCGSDNYILVLDGDLQLRMSADDYYGAFGWFLFSFSMQSLDLSGSDYDLLDMACVAGKVTGGLYDQGAIDDSAATAIRDGYVTDEGQETVFTNAYNTGSC